MKRQQGYLSGGGLLFLVVAAVGLFSGYLYWLKNSGSEVEEAAKRTLKQSQKPQKSKNASKAKGADDQFHFDFFSMLPEEEYEGIEARKPIPKPSSAPAQKPRESQQSRSKTVSKSSPTGNYLIQMGAFRDKAAAESHKAELLLGGIVSNVQINAVKSAKGLVYRVNVGPFQSFSSAEHQQAKLKSAGYNSFLKKYKPSR